MVIDFWYIKTLFDGMVFDFLLFISTTLSDGMVIDLLMFISRPSMRQWSSILGISRTFSMEWSLISFCLYQRPSPMEWSLISLCFYQQPSPMEWSLISFYLYQGPLRWMVIGFPMFISRPFAKQWSSIFFHIKALFDGMVFDLFVLVSRFSFME